MLEPLLERLNSKFIVLASGSPRRSNILKNIGLQFKVIPSTFEENLDKSQFDHPRDYVMENARQKALEVTRRLQKNNENPDIVIGSDTIVFHDNKILEKPKDKEDAFKTLKSLSGSHHKVYSGVVLIQTSNQESCNDNHLESKSTINQFYEETTVMFGEVSDDVIRGYVETREPMDKAGSYGIQGKGATLIEGIQGDFFNVQGFPLYHFCREITKIFKK